MDSMAVAVSGAAAGGVAEVRVQTELSESYWRPLWRTRA